MSPYSSRPAHRARQIVADLLAVSAIVVSLVAAHAVHDAIASWQEYGERVENTGTNLSSSMTNIGTAMSTVPWVGEVIAQPFEAASDAAGELTVTGQNMRQDVVSLAKRVGLALAVVPVVLILCAWLPLRLRFMMRAAKIRSEARLPGADEVLALRALTNLPIRELTAIDPDVVHKWQARDPVIVARLAHLALDHSGVRAPSR